MHRNLRKLLEPPNPLDRFGRLHTKADAANARRDWPAAKLRYAAALRIDPLRDDLWVQYGHALKEMGQAAEACEAYATAARLAPRSPDAQLHAAHGFNDTGRRGEACAAFRAVLTLDPGCTEAREALTGLGQSQPIAVEAPPPFRDMLDTPLRLKEGATLPPGPEPVQWPDLRTLPVRLVPGRRRKPIVFFHLHKTGGLTLDNLIGHHVPPARVCPVKDDRLHVLGRAALDSYDLFSGHCDVGALRLIGRPVQTLSIFREPRARLISFYRFHRGHDLSSWHRVNTFAQLANAMSAEAFFEEERIRQAPEVFNHYLTVFSLTYHQVRASPPATVERVTPAILEQAIARVRALDAIGILERFEDSLALCCARLGLPLPSVVKPLNATDVLSAKMKRQPAPRVAMTPRLAAAMADLVRYDDLIYAAAVGEFEQRLAATGHDATRARPSL